MEAPARTERDRDRLRGEALQLADALGLDRSARALGYRGMARVSLGDPVGLDDYRAAIALATEAGQGREVAVLHNNLGVALWSYEGPRRPRRVRQRHRFASACGLTAIADLVTRSTIEPLIDAGHRRRTRGRRARRERRGGGTGDLLDVRGAQTRVHVLRGQAPPTAGWLEWLESSAHAVARGRPRTGWHRRPWPAALRTPRRLRGARGARDDPRRARRMYYTAYLPALVRAALAIGDSDLAERLVADRTVIGTPNMP